jgi:anaerobic magnesium-protoporphyrin IX monomethyl ester cyclase
MGGGRQEVTDLEVLLVNPPCTEDAPAVPHEVGEPVGLCYLAAELRSRGISVEVLDGFTLALSVAQLVEIVMTYAPRVCVGVSVLETSALAAAKFVSELRRAGYRGHICAGNYYATLNPTRMFSLAPELDSIVRGEGEQAFADLVSSLRSGDSCWLSLPGVCRYRDGALIDGGLTPQPPIDAILEPVRDCLSQTLDAGGTANLVTGRGCYANCSFCSIVAFTGAAGKRFRVRDEKAVVQEMLRLSQDFELERILIPDDNFMLPGRYRAPRVNAFCDAVEASGLKIEFTLTCRADDIHDDLVERLSASGLVGVYLGIESFLPRRLKLFNKGLKPEANTRAFDILDRHGRFVKIGFIMFDPFVTVEEIIGELEALKARLECPTVNHTAIDNLIRHSTYPLELQAGTPVQKKMSAAGRAWELGAGYDYYFDLPESYALMRFAGGLLRFEGPTFAPLRALSYRLCFGERVDGDAHTEIDEACTELWRKFGAAHFAAYLDVVRTLGVDGERDTSPIVRRMKVHQEKLELLRAAAIELIERAGFTYLERPWVRFVDLDRGEHGRVYDPARGEWYVMERAERAALQLWSRTPPNRLYEKLVAEFGSDAAREAMSSVQTKVDDGAFVGTREVDAPLNVEEFSSLIEEIVHDLRANRVGARAFDTLDHYQADQLAREAG